MSKDRRSAQGSSQDHDMGATPPQAQGQQFGSNAERLAYIDGLHNVDEEMASQLDSGLPDAELGILLVEAASTGARKGFYSNDAWKATASDRFDDGQLSRWDRAMSVVWRVDELMSAGIAQSAEYEALLADFKAGAEDKARALANEHAGFRDQGDEEKSAPTWTYKSFKAPFNGSTESFKFSGIYEMTGTVSSVDAGNVWSERVWTFDVRTHVGVERLSLAHEIDAEPWAWLTVKTYTNDFTNTGTAQVESAEWDDVQLS